MAIIIAGERSGVGKTTITLAILAYLQSQGKSIQSFKVGPDYIDPMFHTTITGKPCRNLDPILTSEDYIRWCFEYYSQQAQVTIIEGVMGLFDGVPNDNHPYYGSTAHIAQLLEIPVVLVVDCSKLSTSIEAIVFGYTTLNDNLKIAGVILNKVGSDKHLSLLKTGLKRINIPILGVWFRQQNIELPSRHLGLIPTAEINHFNIIFSRLAQLARQHINWQRLSPYLTNQSTFSVGYFIPQSSTVNLNIAIAKDKSFNFYYQDNLDILTYLGGKLIEFSPLHDRQLPEQINAIYLGGGFPEIFAEQLANNHFLKQEIKQSINEGMTVYAECGGMMYLSKSIEDFQGQICSMVGVLPHSAKMSQKLTLGYRQGRILINNKYLSKNFILRGHEFHHAIDSVTPSSGIIQLQDYYSQIQLPCQGWQMKNIYASYLHLHFANFIPQVKQFLNACQSKDKWQGAK